MNCRIYIFIITLSFLTLFGYGCSDYITDAEKRVKSADWTKMETKVITLKEYSFIPADLVLEKGTPYKLRIVNRGKVKHYFVSEGFFKAIASRKVQSDADGEIKALYFTAIEVFPKRSLDLYFIPVKKGIYPLACTIKGHAQKGMIGKIEIK